MPVPMPVPISEPVSVSDRVSENRRRGPSNGARDFHAHPELMYDLPRTSARVAELLRAFGCDEVVEGHRTYGRGRRRSRS